MVVQGNPDFGLGITGGSSVMVIRAIRSRAWRMQVQTARANHLRVVGG
jgi:hypothetical protein